MDKLYLYSTKVISCSEADDDSDVYKAKFVVCDFSTNRNNRRLNRETIASWMGTLVNKPLVGKLVSSISGEADFTGHNMKTVLATDDDGKLYKTQEFDTQAFGVFTDVGIEKIDNVECITASCDIWKRFPKACHVITKRIEEGTLNTSWEIEISESHNVMEAGKQVKVIDNGVFIGHCLLGKSVTPAYDCSRLLEVAEAEDQDADEELTGAYAEDIKEKDPDIKEGIDLHLENETKATDVAAEVAQEDPIDTSACGDDKDKDKAACGNDKEKDKSADEEDEKDPEGDPTTDPEKDEDETASTGEAEVSALTDGDVVHAIGKALIRNGYERGYIAYMFMLDKTFWYKDWKSNDLDFLVFTFDVDANGNVTLSEPKPATLTAEFKNMDSINAHFTEMASAIASANEKINTLTSELETLRPYKEQVEKAEAEKAEAEKAEKIEALRKYAIDSKLIEASEVSEGGEFASLVEELNESAIKTIIAERYMSNSKKETSEKAVETSTTDSAGGNVQRNLVGSMDVYTDDFKSVMNRYLRGK